MATTQKSRRNGSKSDMNGRQRDVLAALAARAHADADPVAKRVAATNGVTVRTAQRWRRPEDARHSPLYRNTPFVSMSPQRVLAFASTLDLLPEIRRWDYDELVATYRHALEADKREEAEDTCHHFDPTVSWLDAAACSQRDAGWDILKAACEQRFAEMGKTRREVLADLLTEYRNRRKS